MAHYKLKHEGHGVWAIYKREAWTFWWKKLSTGSKSQMEDQLDFLQNSN